jgi:hypothetical protein
MQDKPTNKRTPTARELVAARQQRVTRQPQPPLKPAGKETPVAPVDNRSHRQRLLDELDPSGLVGRRIKFSKDATFVTADDEKEIAKDAEFAALCDQTLHGFLKFNGPGEAPSPIMGLFYDDGFVLPSVESLPCRPMAMCLSHATESDPRL